MSTELNNDAFVAELDKLIAERDRLRSQRDALLEALKGIGTIDDPAITVDDVRRMAMSAIANVEGKDLAPREREVLDLRDARALLDEAMGWLEDPDAYKGERYEIAARIREYRTGDRRIANVEGKE